jgi:hypothetical protein
MCVLCELNAKSAICQEAAKEVQSCAFLFVFAEADIYFDAYTLVLR